jgi:Ca-activated chloride channel family protein
VFLLDVSGSMNEPRKLPLLRNAFKLLTEQLRPQDTVAIVVYAGAGGLVLEPTAGTSRPTILAALERLQAGGSTNGGQGIQLAYALARKSFKKGGINRVILATDGDFNVGVTSQGDLLRMIEQEREGGVFLTVLGLGTGNLKDSTMEQLADKGNGNYAYLDSLSEARKVLVQQAGATLVTIAKDVKIQVEFNPKQVQAYRLIGYENRLMRAEDFNDDKKDAGEIGAGHSVTALYEIVPPGTPMNDRPAVDSLKYQSAPSTTVAAGSGELCFVKIRYKEPQGADSKLLTFPVVDRGEGFANASVDLRFAASVASFGMLLRDSKYKGSASWTMTRDVAQAALGSDANGYRAEFLSLVDRAQQLRPDSKAAVVAK